MKKLYTLGPKFSYSYNLSNQVYDKDENCEVICKTSIAEVFEYVNKNKDSIGIVPIENMINGSVRETFVCLKKYKLKISKSYDFGIHHVLASKSKDFKQIMSHPQAIAQSSDFLKKYRDNGIEILEVSSTSKAFELASQDENIGAIGSYVGAVNYNLDILAENIENNSNNVTRFIEIRNEDFNNVNGVKTSMIIEPKVDRAGLLFEILSIFKIKDINLTKIESLPTGEKIGEYIFYLDVEANLSDKRLTDAITFLETFVEIYLFGSYHVIKI